MVIFGAVYFLVTLSQATPRVFACAKSDYTLRGTECVKTHSVLSQLECPPNFTVVGIMCGRTISGDKTCRQNELLTKTGLCESTTRYAPVGTCPDGMRLVNDTLCQKACRIEPTERCPIGSYLDSMDKCVHKSYTRALNICPDSAVQEGRKCRIQTGRVPPRGKRQLIDSETSFSERIPAQIFTLDGFKKQDHTKKWWNSDLSEYGTAQNKPATQTLSDERLAGNDFVRNGVADGPKLYAAMSEDRATQPPTTKDGSTRPPGLRAPAARPPSYAKVQYIPAIKLCRNGELEGDFCAIQKAVEKELICPGIKIGADCLKLVEIRAESSCLRGELVCSRPGSTDCYCDFTDLRDPDFSCSVGEKRDGLCYIEIPPTRSCPIGYNLDFEGTCTRVEWEAPIKIIF